MERKPRQTIMEEFPEHLRAIGTLAVEIVNLELMLAELLSALLRVPRRAGNEIYFTPRANTLRVQILQNVAAELLASVPEAKGRVISLAKRAIGAINERSKVLHDAWATPDRLRVYRHPAPLTRKPKEPPQPAKLSEIIKHITIIRGLITETKRLTREFDTTKSYATLLRTLHSQDRAEIRAEERKLAGRRKGARPKRKRPPQAFPK